MKAVIMAGGEGTRLRPLTSNNPKPMLPIANIPMMEHVVSLLKRHGFDEIIVTVAFLANVIETYFGDGSEFGVKIHYTTEPTPLGTAGSVRNAADLLDERFLVISGDVLTDVDLGAIVREHDARGAMATIGLIAVENPLEFGIVIAREDGTIERFLEKPTWGQVFSDTINTGIYVLEPSVFGYIPSGRQVDFSSDVFPRMLADGRPLYGSIVHGYWEDVGTLDAYLRSHQDVLDERVNVTVPGFQVQPGVWLGEGAEVDPGAHIEGPAVVGPGCRIEAGVRLGAYTVLGSNVRVLEGAVIERSVIHDNTYIAPRAQLRGTIAGRASNIRSNARCDEGVVLGDEVLVGANSVIAADVKVYPMKTIDEGAVVNESIVWESRGARSLFGRQGVTGLSNVDVTPELAVKVALAYGTSLPRGSTVVTSRDSSRAARMLKRAMIAGLNATGVNVIDLETATMPVTRFVVRSPRAIGGLSVRLVADDTQSIVVRFLDNDGGDIAEDAQRKIERLFQREDYRRALPEEIGEIAVPVRALEEYTNALEGTVDLEGIRANHFKLVIDYSYGATSLVMPTVLSKLGAEVLAVNPYASTEGRISFDSTAAAKRVSGLVQASGAHLGAIIDPDGDRVRFIDDQGRVMTDIESLLCFVDLVSGHMLGDKIALPVNVTSHAAALAARNGVQVRPTKMSAAALMDAAVEPDVGFAADTEGGFIIPGFLPAFDGAGAMVKMLDLLARTGRSLSTVRESLPAVHVAHETCVTPWEQKGLVMRSLVESSGRQLVLVDGVKVMHDNGWALVLPDPQEPLTHVWSEAASDAEARRLAQEYVRRIRQLAR